MGGFVYYIPGTKSIESIKTAGLTYVFDGCNPTHTLCHHGPDSGEGLVCVPRPIGDTEDPTRCGYFQDRQQWVQCGAFWIGWENLPSPADVARRRMIYGMPIEMGDGNEWQIPHAYAHDGESALPQRQVFVDGAPAWSVPAEYQQIEDDGKRVYDSLMGESGSIPRDECVPIIHRAIGVNYRIGPNEITALGLIVWPYAIRALMAISDYFAIQAEFDSRLSAKKNNSDTIPQVDA